MSVPASLRVRAAVPFALLLALVALAAIAQEDRVAVALDDDPRLGSARAPVTLVEFCDFQCPVCGGMRTTLHQLRQRYGNDLQVVYRDFPLTHAHPDAARAAEAGACAHEQGRFWSFSEVVFARPFALSAADLKQRAREAGLDASSFEHCLDTGRMRAEWEADQRDGRRYGVTGTPTYFVNGRRIEGSQSFETLAAVIDQEMAAARARATR